jgi:glycosyltransferase involved in cell wall biosynthesis
MDGKGISRFGGLVMNSQATPTIAVVIPCLNEAVTIGKVIDDFRRELPQATIYVFDNCCTDATSDIASAHGAIVIPECRRGKGFVIDALFNRIDADIYVMVDGDDTYPAEYVHKLLAPVLAQQADMAVGSRLATYTEKSFRPLHVWGNHLVRRLINWIGHAHLQDIMSGYRVFNRRVVQRIPVVSQGFEVETDLTLQMLYYQLPIVEITVPYRERPEGSFSKLHTFRDGFNVLWKLFSLFRAFKPLTFFGGIGLIFLILGLLAGYPPIHDYVTDPQHYVRHVPLAILSVGLVIVSGGCIFLGILLHGFNWRIKELHNVLVRRR